MHRAKSLALVYSRTGVPRIVTPNTPKIHRIQRRYCAKLPAIAESFLNGSSSQYIEDMYNAWLKDPASVHASWDSFFRNSTRGGKDPAYHPPPNEAYLGKNQRALNKKSAAPSQDPTKRSASSRHGAPPQGGGQGGHLGPAEETAVRDHLAVQHIIRSYQFRGHLVAKLDPLGVTYGAGTTAAEAGVHKTPDIIKARHNMPESRMNDFFKLPGTTYIGGEESELPLREILNRLEKVYCEHIGAEYMFIDNEEQCNWIRSKLETPGALDVSPAEKKRLLVRLIHSTSFEAFLAKKYPSEKRFGLEGCDMMIPCMKAIIDRASELGTDTFIMGMPHRGRLNVLANVCRKPLHNIFTQFSGLQPSDEGSGDVKYHLGMYIERILHKTNKLVTMALMANPSHLETVTPVTQGKTRAEQFYKGDCDGKKVLSIILHGDAAFCGQGVVYESIHLSNLPAFTTHGTIHIVVNNQIGFTTDPRFHRSSPNCTDVAKVVNAPIFHVNVDCPECVYTISNIAAEWRDKFRKDVVIDLVSYRRMGHNELDEPMFTQPLMYKRIKALKPCMDLFIAKCIKEKVVTEAEVKDIRTKYDKSCEDEFQKAQKETKVRHRDWIDSPWSGFFENKDLMKVTPTGVGEQTIQHITRAFSSPPPEQFVIHKGVERILKLRMEMVEKRQMDWALGEALAFGSLLKDGIHVRLSGEDVERGTFSHRHHVLHHQNVDKVTYNSLQHLYPDQAQYSVCNSSLSEYAVLGFELGYSLANPNGLILWEAQFGDFANPGQCIFDQMLNSGESKWARQAGLVCLLPHGMEGQGPEHSSARLERFLQLSDDDYEEFPAEGDQFALCQLRTINWIVANCTTPANLFHILRRQIALPFRKPLILMTPKSLLRHPEARSSFDECLVGTEFRRIIPDEGPACKNPQGVKKLVFCSGKVFYDIRKTLKEKNLEDKIAVTRVEQISPFPYDLVMQECEKYPSAHLVWCQEEHKNQGAWTYVQPRFETAVNADREIEYIGRGPAAAPATGNKVIYQTELKNFMAHLVQLDNDMDKC